MTLASGCTRHKTELRIRSFKPDQPPSELYEQFDEAYYSLDARGSLDLILRSVRPSKQDPSQLIRQVVHVNAFWKPIPGRTFVESTQCNATFCYVIGTGPVSISYEGAGFLTFKEEWFGSRIRGKIESGELAPLRRSGRPKDLLGQAQIQGTFRAKRDKAHVLAMLGELRRELGPPPTYNRPFEDRGPR